MCKASLDPVARRSGHEQHLEEPSVVALRGDRRQGAGLPRTADRRRLRVRSRMWAMKSHASAEAMDLL